MLRLVELEGLGERYPGQLSGGQRQRVAFARALAIRPRVLLLDEPFGALDTRVREELREWLHDLHSRTGLTTLLVTHDQQEALEISQHVVVMSEGRVAQPGSPEDVCSRPASLRGVLHRRRQVLRGQVPARVGAHGVAVGGRPARPARASPSRPLFGLTTSSW